MNRKILPTVAAAACSLAALSSVAQGSALTPPYTLNLTDENERNQYTIIDANGDGYTWSGSKYYFRCKTNGDNKADDWLISPAIELTEGSTYTITYIGHNKQSDKPEQVSIMAGTAPTAKAMTLTVMPSVTLTKVQKETNTATFVAPTSGTYYFGFHCTSNAGMYYAYVDGWSIGAAIGKDSPDSVKSLNVTAGAKGALTAQVSFTTPSTTVGGTAITSLKSATLINMNTGRTVAQIENPAVGAAISATDNEPRNGFNRYRVFVTSDNGDGVSRDAQAYVGIDVPKAVGRGNWTQQGSNVVLTWPAVAEVGVNGGYVDPSKVTYTVTMLQPNYTELASKVSGTTYTDASLAGLTTGQVFASYAITPQSAAGEGQGSPTFSGPFGTPFNVPATESFANCQLVYSPWFIIDHSGSDDSSWDIVATTNYPSRTPQDADGGFAVMKTGDDGSHTLASPMFKLGKGSTVKFWLSNPDRYNSLSLMVSDDQCHTWTKLKALPVTKADWEEQSCDLSAYDGKTVCIGFRGEVESYNKQICIDNIRFTSSESGVEQVGATSPLVAVNGSELVVAASGQPVLVCDASGRVVLSRTCLNGTLKQDLQPGIYVVRVGATSHKVVAK